ncbi:hypothetical protein ABMA28_003817 [Loxostege sticticalis]|uniref:PHD-type domain-containing protein n=1 Tax=Loxostege sticticalis TaxID=481309 RepID=A0ABD0STP1_LOXSC
MESSEDDAGPATSASRRASAREKDIGQAEDDNATGSTLQEPTETRASCGTPAMSEDNFDGDSVPSPSAQDVNTSTEAILDMIDEFVDGPGAPKRIPLASTDDTLESECVKTDEQTTTREASEDAPEEEPPPPTIASDATSAKSDPEPRASESVVQPECIAPSNVSLDVVNTDSVEPQQECSKPVCVTNDESLPPGNQLEPCVQSEASVEPCVQSEASVEPCVQPEAPVESCVQPEASLEPCVQSGASLEPCVQSEASSEPCVQFEASLEPCIESEASLEPCVQSEASLESCIKPEASVEPCVESGVSSNPSVELKETSEPCEGSEASSEIPPQNIPSSSVLETVRNVSGESECERLERTVKCVTSSDSRNDVTIESAESTSSDISVSEEKVLGAEQSTRSPLRRRLVRPAPVDRRPDSTVSSTVDIHSTQSTSCESLAKDVSSSSDAVPSVHGNVKPEEIRNLSEISVCKAETSVSPPKKIKLIRQKVNAPTVSRDNSQDKHSVQVEPEQCQSTSSDSSSSNSLQSCTDLSSSSTSKLIVEENVESNTSSHVKETDVQIPSKSSDEDSIPNDAVQKSEGSTNVSSKQISLPEESVKPEEEKKVSPLKIDLSACKSSGTAETETKEKEDSCATDSNEHTHDEPKQVPKLTIKLGNKTNEEMKSPVPKLTIKPIKPPSESIDFESNMQIPNVTKLNIKPILKPDKLNDCSKKTAEQVSETKAESSEQIPNITKLHIKPIPKPPEKINDVHRKSSSSEISESECSENDDTSTSDQASASDQGPSDVVPKVTIKLGKPGTESEGKFYAEKNIPKLTIKGIQHSDKDDPESPSKLTLVISQSEEKHLEKVPKLTIKTVTKSESQPLSPKLTIKPLKPPENISKDSNADHDTPQIPKLKISTECFTTTCSEVKENVHVPKITIKPVQKPDTDSKSNKKSNLACDSPEHIPLVTKLNIKPILKPTEVGETSESLEDKVPVVSKLNIKPIVKPKDNDVDSSIDDVPKITKLNIKPLKNPEEDSSEEKDCDELNADSEENSIPVVSKLNIKPIIKPVEEDGLKDSENQSSETGNSSDENNDHIPVVTKINIKPILKPNELSVGSPKHKSSNEDSTPIVTKLNIKPIVKPEESISPSSPKKDSLKSYDSRNSNIPVVTKLNIKPVIKPGEADVHKSKDDTEERVVKNPPLVMKINMKAMTDTSLNESLSNADKKVNNVGEGDHVHNNIGEDVPVLKLNIKPIVKPVVSPKQRPENVEGDGNRERAGSSKQEIESHSHHNEIVKQNCVQDLGENNAAESSHSLSQELGHSKPDYANETVDVSNANAESTTSEARSSKNDTKVSVTKIEGNEMSSSTDHVSTNAESSAVSTEVNAAKTINKQVSSVKNCTLLKKLLESTESLSERSNDAHTNATNISPVCKDTLNYEQFDSGHSSMEKVNDIGHNDSPKTQSPSLDKVNDVNTPQISLKIRPIHELCKEANENITKPLEINVSEKLTNQSSGQDSPRIILKINKTDHGPSAKIITEEVNKSDTQGYKSENASDVNDKPSPKKNVANSRRKQAADISPSVNLGKRLRSSRIVESTDKSPIIKRIMGKRPPTSDASTQNKDSELTVLESKRLKLGQLLSNKSLTITPVLKKSPDAKPLETKQASKAVNHTIVNNENCSKNGNSKLHNILSNLQANQIQVLPFNDINCLDKNALVPEVESNTSTGSSDVIEVLRVENCEEMIINESSDFRDFTIGADEVSQDPLEIETPKTDSDSLNESMSIPLAVASTPQPKKRGRPRKLPLPVTEVPKPVVLPVPALDERPQRSLRLSRDRPTILAKPRGTPRGRGRGRGRGRPSTPSERPQAASPPAPAPDRTPDAPATPEHIDPTSSRVKLPRMTEALDRLPASCATPLSSRRSTDHFDGPELKVVLESPIKIEDSDSRSRGGSNSGRSWRGRGRGGRTPAKSPRGRGRGRGGGRGAMYMKETMGIYGRVCGPATTTVQLFEEETCMMDDNATPAKPTHLLDEDSQSSVKSSTNESNTKMKKSKFADLFDSNKEWTAADVKEYIWPPADKPDETSQVMMIQEQVAMFLGVKGFRRRYPELARRSIAGAERDHVLAKGLVEAALADRGITAVDASEVLDIMLSDYPHKYEEFRAHQRQKQLAADAPAAQPEPELKLEPQPAPKPEPKHEPPKVDPEKTRQDLAAAAIASAAEWNARLNVLRRPACADLQSMALHTRRPPRPAPARPHLRPPAGFYPHALLPGQYQHSVRVYTAEQLRYFPLNTALEAPPAPPEPDTSSESEPDSARSDSSRDSDRQPAKRKKLTKVKRSNSQTESGRSRSDSRDAEPELCRVCKRTLEANRKHTHERFLVCTTCSAKLHPICTELGADTIRKCREYSWQCSTCKLCGACRLPGPALLCCSLCDRGFHLPCIGLDAAPAGRWHCVECAICKSCGARSPGGAGAAAADALGAAPDWHHQTRRGPGGHKVYSHSLCTPCARAYRIGRYCPLCDRSFIGPKGTMQLVICKLCDRQLHQECVRQTVSALNVLDYTCGECRRGGITSRAAAVRLAPRTIATLFMAKRRFNKYAHRQYLASRRRGQADAESHADAEADAESHADAEADADAHAEADRASDASD